MKKPLPPIAGQTRLEKFIDLLPSVSSFPVFFTWHVGGMFLLPFMIHITQNVLNNTLLPNLSIMLWLVSEIILLFLLLLNIFVSSWELKHEEEIANRIKTHVTEHADCTYDELAIHCMPRKIHVGLESAVQRLVSTQKIVRYSDNGTIRLRLPTDEERLTWYIECGETLSFSNLRELFDQVIPDYDDYLDIEFFLFEKFRYRMGQTPYSDTKLYTLWLCAEGNPKATFATLEDMFSAPLLHDKTLYDLWPDAIVTEINGDYAEEWLHVYDSYCYRCGIGLYAPSRNTP